MLALSVGAAVGASGCTQGVVPGSAYDTPLISLSGIVQPNGGLIDARHPIVTLLWIDPLQEHPDLPAAAHWLESSVDVKNDTFFVRVFRPPPPEAMVDLADASGEVSRLAVAEIVIVDDQDGDGSFRVQGPRATISPPDRYLAGSEHVLTYVAIPFPSPQTVSPLTLPGQSGFAVVTYACAGQLSAATHPVPANGVELVVQPSQDFPTVSPCRASHGP